MVLDDCFQSVWPYISFNVKHSYGIRSKKDFLWGPRNIQRQSPLLEGRVKSTALLWSLVNSHFVFTLPIASFGETLGA